MSSHINIDLPSFLDFCTTIGTARIKIVSRAKKIDPAQLRHDDFYHQMSEALRDMHLKEAPKVLDAFLHAQTDERRRRIYPGLIEGYRKFLKDQGPKVTWLAPPATTVRYGDLHVRVEPELGLFLGDSGHIIATARESLRAAETPRKGEVRSAVVRAFFALDQMVIVEAARARARSAS